jgi:3-hydroxybutyryl-CoA dehydratase
MTVPLEQLSRGDRIAGAASDFSKDWVASYIDAVEDKAIGKHGDLAPPMAIATLSVRALLEQVRLPEGAVHAGQGLVVGPAVQTGAGLGASAIIKSRGERSGWVLMNVAHEVLDDMYEQVLVGEALLAFPSPETKPAQSIPTAGASDQSPPPTTTNGLQPVVKQLTQDKINRYAEVSGDHNPLHVDSAFAATTQFGGTIAHGMLLLAYISEMMTGAFGEAWLNAGRLKVRFRDAARPGDHVTAEGSVTSIKDGYQSHPGGAPHRRTFCEVACRNQSGLVLISGTAEVAEWPG